MTGPAFAHLACSGYEFYGDCAHALVSAYSAFTYDAATSTVLLDLSIEATPRRSRPQGKCQFNVNCPSSKCICSLRERDEMIAHWVNRTLHKLSRPVAWPVWAVAQGTWGAARVAISWPAELRTGKECHESTFPYHLLLFAIVQPLEENVGWCAVPCRMPAILQRACNANLEDSTSWIC